MLWRETCHHAKVFQCFGASTNTCVSLRYSTKCLTFNAFTSLHPGSTSLYHSSSITSSFLVLQQNRVSDFKRYECPNEQIRLTSSNSRWTARQRSDPFTKEAKVTNLKSRAAFKLLQINDKYQLFRPGMTVVDLGFAPGSWSQVAIDLVRPGLGRVLGVDIIPVAPPKGANAIQGDFMSAVTQERVRELLRDENRGKARHTAFLHSDDTGYLDQERADTAIDNDIYEGKCIDVVLSDMSAPWDIVSGLGKNTLSNPYYRLMNTSGNRFKDHVGSMDLCRSALYFAFETLKVGGNFVCKFYQGAEDKQFEKQMKAMFHKVHREKPESSRSESKEAFFVGIKRLAKADQNAVFDEGS